MEQFDIDFEAEQFQGESLKGGSKEYWTPPEDDYDVIVTTAKYKNEGDTATISLGLKVLEGVSRGQTFFSSFFLKHSSAFMRKKHFRSLKDIARVGGIGPHVTSSEQFIGVKFQVTVTHFVKGEKTFVNLENIRESTVEVKDQAELLGQSFESSAPWNL